MKNCYVPPYLRDRYQLIATVTFTALWSLVFILCSFPFSGNGWFELGTSGAFYYTALFFFACLLLEIVSKCLMYLTRTTLKMTYVQLVLWHLTEVVLVSLLYAVFTDRGVRAGIIIPLAPVNLPGEFLKAFQYAFVCLVIPEVTAGMFFAIVDKNKTIRLMNTNDVVSDEPRTPKGTQKVTLYDNSGVMKLSVSLSNLFYIESDDNYIIVWYTDSKGDLKKYMIRCRLKTVEESFKGSSLVRCHRKYIVNMDKVKVLRKEKDGYELDLENDAIPPITITKTYADNVLSLFNDRP